MEYDKDVKKFFYDDYKSISTTITIVITETSTGKTQEIVLTKQISEEQVAPRGLKGLSPTTANGKDGKITGVTKTMEYRLKGEKYFKAITGTEITSLVPGTYEVRYAAKEGLNAGKVAEVVVPEYKEFNVIDELNSEFIEPGIPGTAYVAVKLNDGLKYSDYTATIKGTSTELKYDEKDVKKFFYDDYKSTSTTITIVITETSTGKTQEIVLTKKTA